MKLASKKIIITLLFGMMFLGVIRVNVFAANATISASSVEISQGDAVNVDVAITSDAAMGVAEIFISYDPALLEYTGGEGAGGAGLIKYAIYDFDATGKNKTFTVSFKAKVAGSSPITVGSNSRVLELNVDPDSAQMALTTNNGQVNVKAPTTASSDCNLTALAISAVDSNGGTSNVNFIPSFSADVYEYKADLAANVAKLVVSTTLSDANATTKVSGTRIDPGDNLTTITVIAEDGTKKDYKLYTKRGNEETTTEQPSSEGETTQPQSTEEPIDRTPIKVSAINKYIIQDYNLVTVPEGFEENTTTYDGKKITCLKGISKPIALLCLSDDTEGTNAAYYIYNEVDSSMSKMINISTSQKIYTIIPVGDDYKGPTGYKKTTLDINGDTVASWIKEDGSEFYVVYAMNYNGESALYVYDSKEQTLQRYIEGNKSSDIKEEPSVDEMAVTSLQNKYNQIKKQYDSDKDNYYKIIIVLVVVILILIITCIILMFKANVIKEDDEDNDEEDNDGEGSDEENSDEEDAANKNEQSETLQNSDSEIIGSTDKELQLDLVAKVNEVKAEKLAANVSEVMEDNNNQNHIDAGIENSEENNKEEIGNKQEKEEGILIDLEEDEPFEVEFVDLEEDDK